MECPLNQVLWAEVDKAGALHLSLLHKQKHGLALWKMTGTFKPILRETAVDWTESLMDTAYEGNGVFLLFWHSLTLLYRPPAQSQV